MRAARGKVVAGGDQSVTVPVPGSNGGWRLPEQDPLAGVWKGGGCLAPQPPGGAGLPTSPARGTLRVTRV
jgi:hypothetical protein